MQYFGGKQRVASEIAQIIYAYRPDDSVLFFEPFLGGANICTKISGRRAAADVNTDLILMYRALQRGWIPPTDVSEDLYKQAKNGNTSASLRAFVGFGCSFAGKWFGGYARSDARNYALNAANSLKKKAAGLHGVQLFAKSYQSFNPKNCVVYCDPPYQGTTQYGAAGAFDTEVFWGVMRLWAQSNIVLVSEYRAPDFCEVVWEKAVVTDIRGASGKISRTEKLFLVGAA
jgi:DNA adenine methylase